MSTLDNAVRIQLEMIQAKLGMTIHEMAEIVQRTKLTRANDIRWMIQREYGLSHGDAKLLANAIVESQTPPALLIPAETHVHGVSATQQ